MADKLHYALVSPERMLAEGEADMVVIPGMNGDFAAMPDHAPFLTTLRPGVVTVTDGSDTSTYFVTGGFAEISAAGASILAEESLPRADATREWLDEKIVAAETALADAAEDGKPAASQRLDDLKSAADMLA
ncbi:MAG: ATP synthase F1 subunit epsilon [Pseudomonadota bacterium]